MDFNQRLLCKMEQEQLQPKSNDLIFFVNGKKVCKSCLSASCRMLSLLFEILWSASQIVCN